MVGTDGKGSSLPTYSLSRSNLARFWDAMKVPSCLRANFWSTIQHIEECDRSLPINSNEKTKIFTYSAYWSPYQHLNIGWTIRVPRKHFSWTSPGPLKMDKPCHLRTVICNPRRNVELTMGRIKCKQYDALINKSEQVCIL